MNSDLKSIILDLGGFQTIMSFLSSIGHLMSYSGLCEVLELIYGENAVIYMLSGKSYSRAIHGHFSVGEEFLMSSKEIYGCYQC